MEERKRVVVVGGGIAGLATALRLRDAAASVPGGLEVVVLEASDRPGGNLRTERRDGFIVEWGPNGYLDNVPAMGRLVERLGLAGRLQPADEEANERYLFRGGRLHPVPTGPLAFLGSGLLGFPGRLRVFLEPFARRPPEGVDESVHGFASRRIGREAADVLVDAMVSGVFAGDARRLSLASAFPKMARMEEEHGGLVRAMLARVRRRRAERRRAARDPEGPGPEVRPGGPAGPGGTLTSFDVGLDVLVGALAEELAGALALGRRVVSVERTGGAAPGSVEDRRASGGVRPAGPAPGAPRWTVVTGGGERFPADAVVLAAPAGRLAPVLAGVDEELAGTVGEIRSAGLAVIALGYDAAAIGGPPRGFGFLAPRSEGLRSLGCLWDSSIFPGRAPAGQVLVRVMIGGAHDPEAVALAEEELVAIARGDLATAMGLEAEPLLVRVFRHPRGIAQYELGHGARLARIEERLAELPGLWVTGSSFYGVSMNACVEAAERQAERTLEFLGADDAGGSAAGGPTADG